MLIQELLPSLDEFTDRIVEIVMGSDRPKVVSYIARVYPVKVLTFARDKEKVITQTIYKVAKQLISCMSDEELLEYLNYDLEMLIDRVYASTVAFYRALFEDSRVTKEHLVKLLVQLVRINNTGGVNWVQFIQDAGLLSYILVDPLFLDSTDLQEQLDMAETYVYSLNRNSLFYSALTGITDRKIEKQIDVGISSTDTPAVRKQLTQKEKSQQKDWLSWLEDLVLVHPRLKKNPGLLRNVLEDGNLLLVASLVGYHIKKLKGVTTDGSVTKRSKVTSEVLRLIDKL